MPSGFSGVLQAGVPQKLLLSCRVANAVIVRHSIMVDDDEMVVNDDEYSSMYVVEYYYLLLLDWYINVDVVVEYARRPL